MDNGASSYRRFLDGDESAFDDLMKELFRGLVFFINRYVHDTHAAEDIAIDAFSDLVVHRHRYNFKVSLKTYLYMVGRSRALDYIKHRKAVNFVELSEAEGVSDEQRLEEIVLTDERSRALALCIPLVLCITICTVTILPATMPTKSAADVVGEERAEESQVHFYTEVVIRNPENASADPQKITDPAEVTKIFSVIENLYGNADSENGGLPETSSGLDGCRITFRTEDGLEIVYILDGKELVNVNESTKITLTDSQAAELKEALGVSE